MANIRTYGRVFWGEFFALFMECIKPPISVARRLTRSRKKQAIFIRPSALLI
jgi:hypothetical protein